MSIPPVPYQTPMTDKGGLPSQPWAVWFRQILSNALSPPAANITGVVQINQGGTGQITQQAALDAIAGAQSAGKVLRSDGTHTTLSAIQAGDVPTLNQNTTGSAASFSGSLAGDVTGTQSTTAVGKVNGLALPISKTVVGTNASGQIVDASTALLSNDTTGVSANVTGLVAIANGGTGQTTANAALNNLLPTQTANSGKYLTTNGTNTSWSAVAGGSTAPTVQRFTTGTGTYTTPTSPAPLYLKVKMVGGGGGGSGSGTSSANPTGGAGGNSTFGTSLLVANGGGGGANNNGVSSTASASVSSPAIILCAVSGAAGGGTSETGTSGVNIRGGEGGNSPFGGAGAGSWQLGGTSAATNSGSGGGGGGGGGSASFYSGGGGAAGAYLEAIINSPSATYSYAVGAAGTAGSAGTSGTAGGAGGAGLIIVEEHYQ